MKQKSFYLEVLIVVVLAFLCFELKVSAETNGKSPFSANVILPENQIDKGRASYDLLMKPGQEQILEAILSNSSKESIVVEARVNTATTNNNGYVDYGEHNKKEYDKTLKFPLSEYAKVESKKIVIPPQKSKILKINIRMPNRKVEGIIAGGLHIKAKRVNGEPIEDNSNSTIQIKDQSVYAIALQMRQEIDDAQKIAQNIYIDEKKILPSLVNGRAVVNINIQNRAPLFVKHFKIVAEVYRGKKLVHRSVKDSMSMAPNSNFNFPVSWENQRLKGGKYYAKVILTNGNNAKSNAQKQSWRKEFIIDRKMANELNDKSVEKHAELVPDIFAGAASIIVLGGFFVSINKRKNKQQKQKKVL